MYLERFGLDPAQRRPQRPGLHRRRDPGLLPARGAARRAADRGRVEHRARGRHGRRVGRAPAGLGRRPVPVRRPARHLLACFRRGWTGRAQGPPRRCFAQLSDRGRGAVSGVAAVAPRASEPLRSIRTIRKMPSGCPMPRIAGPARFDPWANRSARISSRVSQGFVWSGRDFISATPRSTGRSAYRGSPLGSDDAVFAPESPSQYSHNSRIRLGPGFCEYCEFWSQLPDVAAGIHFRVAEESSKAGRKVHCDDASVNKGRPLPSAIRDRLATGCPFRGWRLGPPSRLLSSPTGGAPCSNDSGISAEDAAGHSGPSSSPSSRPSPAATGRSHGGA